MVGRASKPVRSRRAGRSSAAPAVSHRMRVNERTKGAGEQQIVSVEKDEVWRFFR